MSRIQGVRKAVLAGLVGLGLSSMAFAQTSTPATGLGQAWPNTADVSSSPHWHVYVFQLNGIKYVQVNDLNGQVHAAVATANGTTIVLPMGTDSRDVTTTPAAAASTETVYQDSATTVTATPQSSGTTKFAVAATDSCPQAGCSGPGITKAIH